MVKSNTFMVIFVAIAALCLIGEAQSEYDEFYQFMNYRYPALYNRALRSMGKPTFIRFGKRSNDSPLLLHPQQLQPQQQQMPQIPFEQLTQPQAPFEQLQKQQQQPRQQPHQSHHLQQSEWSQ